MTTTLARTFVPDLFAGMNKTEKRRALELEAERRAGRIAAWWYERFTFKLADDCRYTPDFVVLELDGVLRCEETKGFWREDAFLKIKLAAEHFPLRFVAYQSKAGGWEVRDFTRYQPR